MPQESFSFIYLFIYFRGCVLTPLFFHFFVYSKNACTIQFFKKSIKGRVCSIKQMKGRTTESQAIKSLAYVIVNATQASFFYHFGVFHLMMTQNTLTVLPEGNNG